MGGGGGGILLCVKNVEREGEEKDVRRTPGYARYGGRYMDTMLMIGRK